ncbi:MAG: iron-siderophore ABC transporter substrate-binding protein [Acidimicrobiia bacterium]
MSRRSRPGPFTALATIVVAALVLVACGGSEREDDDAGGSVAEGEFPVTIEHAYGSTEITEAPRRVVTVGWSSADTAVALGVVPVAIPADTWAGDADGYLPWLRDAVEEIDGTLPTTYIDMPELDIDAVIDADPDLILAVHSGIDQATFQQLNGIAPTVAFPGDPWLTGWEDQTRITAQALGQAERGDELVEEVYDQLEEAAGEHPEFEGKTFAYVFAGEGGNLAVYLPGDARVAILEKLGFVIPEVVSERRAAAGSFTATLSIEEADELNDVDVIFTWFNDQDEQDALEANPLFAQIPAVEEGRYVPLLDRPISMATTAVSVLSVPWVLDAWLPTISKAVGD